MREGKLDKEGKKLIIGMIILGIILNLFLDRGIDISILIFVSIISHKYIGSTKQISYYDNYEFLDEDKYNRGLRYFVWFIDVYVIVRIATILLLKYNRYNMLEIQLLILLMILYEKQLQKKYVKSINNLDTNIKPVFIKNKVITSIVLIVFVGFTVIFFNTINKNKTEDFIKFGKYEYNLTYNKNDKRTVSVKSESMYMSIEETDENSKYFDNYIIKVKKLINIKIFERYSFVSMMIMFLLVIIQKCSRNKYTKYPSRICNLFLVGVIIFGIITFNNNSIELEDYVLSYFHNNISNH